MQPTCGKDDLHHDYSASLLQAHRIFSNSLCEHGEKKTQKKSLGTF